MHTLKTLLIVAVLSAVAYGVYVALTGTPDAGPPPGASEEGYDAAPTVELPATQTGHSNGTGSAAISAAAPNSLGEAPPYIPQVGSRDNDNAPPYVPPQVGPQAPGAVGNAPPGAYPDAAPDARNLDTRYPPSGVSTEPAAGIPVDAPPHVLGGGAGRKLAHQLRARRVGRCACRVRRRLPGRAGAAGPR